MKLENILFLDIETVPQHPTFDDLSEETQGLFADKTKYQRKDTPVADFYERAGIWAEFGKIICISVGYFTSVQSKSRQFRITTFKGDEVDLLSGFSTLVNNHFSKAYHRLCAHNGKEFDFPYIARRMTVHQLELPRAFQIAGKKPWEVPHLDTLELWKFGDYKSSISLRLLSEVLGLSSKKIKSQGKEIANKFYLEKQIDKIVEYCENDVFVLSQVILRFRNDPLLKDEEVVFLKN